MTLHVLNDWHIGCVRSAGTTPATAYQLRLDLLQQFEEILYKIDTDLMILGDLFDGPDISKFDLLRTYQILDDWLGRTGKSLWLVNGNHDLSKRSDNFSSFQLLAALLSAEGAYAGTVTHITEGTMTPHGYVIPHVGNQDIMDVELSKVPDCDHLFVHCNWDNGFAVDSDHSLNLSKEQAKALPVKHIFFAHVHQATTALAGKVVVIGNQAPSSVSDCLNNEIKSMLLIHGPGEFQDVGTWQAQGDFREVDWKEISGLGGTLPERFIRVTGQATAAEADRLVTTLARFRKESAALVITNAVKIEGVDDAAVLSLSHEEITSFNVREALAEFMGPEDWARIEALEKPEEPEEKEAA